MKKEYAEMETDERAQEAYNLWKQGLSIKQIGNRMGIVPATVGNYLHRFPDYINRESPNAAKANRMKKYFEEGKPVQEISQLEHISTTSVRRWRERMDYVTTEVDKNSGSGMYGFEWKWPVTVNRLLKAAGKKTQPVPEHSREAERQWFIA